MYLNLSFSDDDFNYPSVSWVEWDLDKSRRCSVGTDQGVEGMDDIEGNNPVLVVEPDCKESEKDKKGVNGWLGVTREIEHEGVCLRGSEHQTGIFLQTWSGSTEDSVFSSATDELDLLHEKSSARRFKLLSDTRQ